MLTRAVVRAVGLAVAMSAALGIVLPVSAQVRLDVMTFNIRTANGRDGDNAWLNRRTLVAETIRKFGPHVLGLQEVVNEQIEYLAAALPDYRWLGIDRELNGGVGLSEYVPIFYRHAELSPIESGNFWLLPTPDAPPRVPEGGRVSRIVTWAKFHHLATGKPIYVFNTHFTLRQGEAQLDSARMIKARIAPLPAESIVVLTGDFNAVAETSEPWRELAEASLADAWLVAGERRGPASTLSGFGPPREGEASRIDWILVRGPVVVRTAETVLHNEGGRYPSDHYPVAASLDLR
jgi:endonuclease/exonuclease/phosphatase family metal-dependent hydrolase